MRTMGHMNSCCRTKPPPPPPPGAMFLHPLLQQQQHVDRLVLCRQQQGKARGPDLKTLIKQAEKAKKRWVYSSLLP